MLIKNKKSFKFILWDFGGVLTNSPIKNFYEYEKKNNIPINSIIKINSMNKFENAWAKAEKGLINKKEFIKLFHQESKKLGINNINPNAVLDCLDLNINYKMIDLLIKLKKQYGCACLTNNFIKEFSTKTSKLFEKFKHYFDIVFESNVLNCRKPEMKIYYIVLEKLKVNPQEILFIDDLGINLKPAKKIGFVTYKFVNTKDTINFLNKEL